MRTTITLPDELVRALKRRAVEHGRPFRTELEATLVRGLAPSTEAKRYRLKTARLGSARSGDRLHKALDLAGELEDVEVVRELERRK